MAFRDLVWVRPRAQLLWVHNREVTRDEFTLKTLHRTRNRDYVLLLNVYILNDSLIRQFYPDPAPLLRIIVATAIDGQGDHDKFSKPTLQSAYLLRPCSRIPCTFYECAEGDLFVCANTGTKKDRNEQ